MQTNWLASSQQLSKRRAQVALTLRSPPLGGRCTSVRDWLWEVAGAGGTFSGVFGGAWGGGWGAEAAGSGGGATFSSFGGGGEGTDIAPASPTATFATFVPGVTVSPSFAVTYNYIQEPSIDLIQRLLMENTSMTITQYYWSLDKVHKMVLDWVNHGQNPSHMPEIMSFNKDTKLSWHILEKSQRKEHVKFTWKHSMVITRLWASI